MEKRNPEKATMRDFITHFLSLDGMDAEAVEFAQNELHKLDERNAARKARLSPKQEENEVMKLQMIDIMVGAGGQPVTAAEVAEKLEVSRSKASALLRQLVLEQKCDVSEVKSGKSKVKGYSVTVAQ